MELGNNVFLHVITFLLAIFIGRPSILLLCVTPIYTQTETTHLQSTKKSQSQPANHGRMLLLHTSTTLICFLILQGGWCFVVP